MKIDPPSAERIVDVALRGAGATIPTSLLPARRLHRLTGRRGGFAQSFLNRQNTLIRCWTFDVLCSLVYFTINLSAPMVSGWADTWNLYYLLITTLVAPTGVASKKHSL